MHTCGFVVFNRLASLEDSGWPETAGDSVQPGSAESSVGASAPPEMHSLLKSHCCGSSYPSRDLTKYPEQAYFPTDEQYSPVGGKGKKEKLSTHLF